MQINQIKKYIAHLNSWLKMPNVYMISFCLTLKIYLKMIYFCLVDLWDLVLAFTLDLKEIQVLLFWWVHSKISSLLFMKTFIFYRHWSQSSSITWSLFQKYNLHVYLFMVWKISSLYFSILLICSKIVALAILKFFCSLKWLIIILIFRMIWLYPLRHSFQS